jgi:hypothetical protein
MAEMKKRYVCTASSPGGNGTTSATSGGDRAYASLEECMNAEECTQTGYFTVEVTGDCSAVDSTAVVIHNYVSNSPTNYINIYTVKGSSRHPGKYSTSHYRLNTGATGNVLTLEVDYIKITGLQVCVTGGYSVNSTGIGGGEYYCRGVEINKNVILQTVSGSYGTFVGIGCGGWYANLKIKNNIIYDLKAPPGNASIGINVAFYQRMTAYIFNNTVTDCDNGIKGDYASGQYSSGQVIKNNICNGNGVDYSGTFSASATNLSEDSTSPDGVSYRTTNGTVIFNDEAGDDFHLGSTDTNAIGRWTDVSGDSDCPVTDDVDEDVRGNDIGADEFVSAGTNASITQVKAELTTTGGTQAVATVDIAAITQSAASATLTGGTQAVATIQVAAVTQGVYIIIIYPRNFQVVSCAAIITQVAGTLAVTGGTQEIATQISVSIEQTAASLTVSSGTQIVDAVSTIAITQAAASLTLTTGTQVISTGAIVNASISQVAASLSITSGTQSVAALQIAEITQVAIAIVLTGGTQGIGTAQIVSIIQSAQSVALTAGTQIVTTGALIQDSVTIDSILPSTSVSLGSTLNKSETIDSDLL